MSYSYYRVGDAPYVPAQPQVECTNTQAWKPLWGVLGHWQAVERCSRKDPSQECVTWCRTPGGGLLSGVCLERATECWNRAKPK